MDKAKIQKEEGANSKLTIGIMMLIVSAAMSALFTFGKDYFWSTTNKKL